jgi:hypothetical protein
VVEADGEEELRAYAADDPVVTTGTGTIEVGRKALVSAVWQTCDGKTA